MKTYDEFLKAYNPQTIEGYQELLEITWKCWQKSKKDYETYKAKYYKTQINLNKIKQILK